MPKKILKMQSGKVVEIYAVRLQSGGIVVPSRMPHDRTIGYWGLVRPDSQEAKWWSGVTIDGPDPRAEPGYQARLAGIHASPKYKKWNAQRGKRKD
jgi:hypothetical protein